MLSSSGDEIRQFVRACFQIFQIEYTFGEPAKESRHSVFEHFAARAKERSIRIKLASERDEVALVSARSVQQEQGPIRTAGNEFVNEIGLQSHDLCGTWIGGRILSICERADSIHGGMRRCVPNSSSFSSKVKPGGSVSISKSTPPGSRK